MTDDNAPRLIGRKAAADYCGIGESTFSAWVASHKMPPALPGTRKWDRKAISARIDEMSGLMVTTTASIPRQGPIALTSLPKPDVQPKGIVKVKNTLADGSTIYYCYAWRGKGAPLLKAKDGSPLQPGDPTIPKAYAEAVAYRNVDYSETMDALITAFKVSSEFTSKSPKTRQAYDRYLDDIRRQFGALTFEALEDKKTRGKFKAWRDGIKDKPRTADYAWTTLARVLSVAKDRGRISVNVCEKGGRLYTADRTDNIWEAEHIAALVAVAGQEVRLALLMALWTGQRQGDLLRATWSAYDGKTLKVRQGKTGARVTIPIGPLLKEALDATPRRSTTILTNTKGRSWTEDGFRTTWGKTVSKAKVEGLTFHDLRGTAVTRLALAGCSSIQIGAITGHSPKDVDTILAAHYLGGKVELAEQAMSKLHEYVELAGE